MSVVLPLLLGPAAGVVLAGSILALGHKPKSVGFFAKASMDRQHLNADQREEFLNRYQRAHQKVIRAAAGLTFAAGVFVGVVLAVT